MLVILGKLSFLISNAIQRSVATSITLSINTSRTVAHLSTSCCQHVATRQGIFRAKPASKMEAEICQQGAVPDGPQHHRFVIVKANTSCIG